MRQSEAPWPSVQKWNFISWVSAPARGLQHGLDSGNQTTLEAGMLTLSGLVSEGLQVTTHFVSDLTGFLPTAILKIKQAFCFVNYSL